jgi:hypothetical protein
MDSFFLFSSGRIFVRDIENYPIPAVLTYKSPVDREKHLLPGAQFVTAMRARIVDFACL